MARLVIKLLGCFQVSIDGRPQTGIVSDKGRALLTYLALEAERPHRREVLAEMLWPNQPYPEGRANLRQSLHRLRRYLDEPPNSSPTLLITPQEIMFNCDSDCWLDAAEFCRLLGAVNTHHPADLILCEICVRQLQHAADLYQGDLLAGFCLPNSPRFDWWLLSKVEEYHHQALFMLDRLVIHLKHNGDFSVASRYAQHAIELEPWHEQSHRQKMHLLALGGNPGAANCQYDTCHKILAAEMGIEPSNKMKNLLEQIRLGYSLNREDFEEDQQYLRSLTAPA
jgi:DNA-binding SARP family transcriptional activator